MAKRRPSVWKRLRYRLEVAGARLLAFGVPKLSRGRARRLAAFLAKIAHVLDKRGRTTALANLAAAFPSLSEAERQDLTRAAYRHFQWGIVDLFWTPPRLHSVMDQARHEIQDPADFEECRRGAMILVTLHYGPFEWLSLDWSQRFGPVTVIAEEFKNAALEPILARLREAGGGRVIPQERAMVRLLKRLRAGGSVAFLSDLTVPPSKAATIIECFGLKTCVTAMHAILAQRTGAPIVPVIALPQADGGFVARVGRSHRPSPEDSVRDVAQRCWNAFEPEIRRDPAPWLWMYKHWRHLPEDPAEAARYPAYANASDGFTALEREIGA